MVFNPNFKERNGKIEIDISGAAYDEIDTNKFIFLPKGHNYKITGQATGIGHFNARVRTVDNGQITKYVYYDQIPINSTSTSMELDFVNGAPSDEIKVDQSGKKEFNARFKPNSILKGKQLLINTAPKTNVSVKSGDEKTATSVVLVVPNNNGLAILRTEYSLDGGKTWNTYKKEITLDKSQLYNIKYRSIDVAGHVEKAKEKIIEVK